MIQWIGWPEIMIGGILLAIYGIPIWLEIRKRLERQKKNPASSPSSLR
jgi:hypothetical protein